MPFEFPRIPPEMAKTAISARDARSAKMRAGNPVRTLRSPSKGARGALGGGCNARDEVIDSESGSSSEAERQLSKLNVAGSIPASRSSRPDIRPSPSPLGTTGAAAAREPASAPLRPTRTGATRVRASAPERGPPRDAPEDPAAAGRRQNRRRALRRPLFASVLPRIGRNRGNTPPGRRENRTAATRDPAPERPDNGALRPPAPPAARLPSAARPRLPGFATSGAFATIAFATGPHRRARIAGGSPGRQNQFRALRRPLRESILRGSHQKWPKTAISGPPGRSAKIPAGKPRPDAPERFCRGSHYFGRNAGSFVRLFCR